MLVCMLEAGSNQMPKYRMYWHLQITNRFIYWDSTTLSQEDQTLLFKTDDRRRIKDLHLWEYKHLSGVCYMAQKVRGMHFKYMKRPFE